MNLASDKTTPCTTGSRASGETGAGAARHHRHLARMTDFHHGHDLGLGFRQGDRQRHLAA
jgi:hypothetical protein